MGPLPYAPTLAPLPKGKKPKTARPTPSEADHQAPGSVRLDHGNVGAVSFEVVEGGGAADDEDEDDGSQSHRQKSLRVVTAGRRGNHALKLREVVQPMLVYPSTRRRPHAAPDLTPVHLTESSKRYLAILPEVAHVPYDLVHDLVTDAQKEKEFEPWDPYVGNCIATTSVQNVFFPNSAAVGLVAFRAGSNGQDLNVSTLTLKQARRGTMGERFTPSVRPVASFLTPIQQIISSPYQSINNESHRYSQLAVRTVSGVHLVQVQLRPTSSDNEEPVLPTELLSFTRKDTGGARHVDMAMSPWERGRGVGVSDDGSLWEFGSYTSQGEVRPAGKVKTSMAYEAPLQGTRAFHRIDFGATTNETSLLSERTVVLLDLRTPQKDLTLMDLTDSTSLFTSIERKTSDARYSSYLQCFSTTESVSWVDIRMPGKAVVSWEHHRDFDRSLELLSIDTDDISSVLLTSKRDNVVTAYTTQLDSSESLYDPYMLTSAARACLPRASTRSRRERAEDIPISKPIFDVRNGSTFFRHPSLPSDWKDSLFLEVSSRGGVVLRRLGMRSDEDLEREAMLVPPALAADWTDEVRALAEDADEDEETNEAERWGGDLVKVHQAFNEAHSPTANASSLEESLPDRLNAAEQYLRELDAPLEGMLTGHDLAHYATSDGPSALQSVFLSDSGIHPRPDEHSRGLETIGKTDLSQGAASTHSIASRVQALAGTQPDPARAAKALATEYGFSGSVKAERSVNVGRDACNLLALDLHLASTVYTSEPILSAPDLDPDDELERATQAMSLYGDDGSKKQPLPPLHFGFVRPLYQKNDWKGKGRASNPFGNSNEGTVSGGTTTRSLMSTWIVGEDPAEYRHVDLHHGEERTQSTRTTAVAAAYASSLAQSQSQILQSQSLRPGGPASQPPSIATTGPSQASSRRLQPPAIITTAPSIPGRLLPSVSFSRSDSNEGESGGSLPILRGSDPFRSHINLSQHQPLTTHLYSSQDAWNEPQTQPLPGAHGGRPLAGGFGGAQAGKKKKKRVGGF